MRCLLLVCVCKVRKHLSDKQKNIPQKPWLCASLCITKATEGTNINIWINKNRVLLLYAKRIVAGDGWKFMKLTALYMLFSQFLTDGLSEQVQVDDFTRQYFSNSFIIRNILSWSDADKP